MYFQANASEISFESDNDEVLIINQNTGLYFVLEDVAAQIWGWLSAGISVETIKSSLPKYYEVTLDEVAQTVDQFIEELETKRLIIPTKQTPAANPTIEMPEHPLPYKAPVLQSHQDAQSFIVAHPFSNETRLTISHNNVTSDVYPDEALVLDLSSGVYYSLQNAAKIIWDGVIQQATIDEITKMVAQVYAGSYVEMEDAVRDFVQQLHTDKLVRALRSDEPQPDQPFSHEFDSSSERPPFEKPKCERFSDMQHLLLLDPIHDVDGEYGWPKQLGDD